MRTNAGRSGWFGGAVVGFALPVPRVAAYYALHGALFELVDGVALFNLLQMENEATLHANLRGIQQAMLLFYKPAGLPSAVGLFGVLGLYPWR